MHTTAGGLGWRSNPWLALAVRITLAVPLILHGLAAGASLPAPLAATVTTLFRFLADDPGQWLALIGGGLLLVGLATRPAVIVLIMVALMSRQVALPFWPLNLVDVAISLLFLQLALGAGAASLDRLFARKPRQRAA